MSQELGFLSQNINEISDLHLVEEVRRGDRASFSVLVKRHQKGVIRLVMRFMKDIDRSQDVTQEAFIKAFEKINSFEGRASFKSWLYQIAINTAKNKLRENRHDFTDIDKVHLSINAVAESQLVHKSLVDLLNQEVEHLPFKQKTALVLRVYEDMSFSEIADVMCCPYDTAKANYRHAIMKLKSKLSQHEELKTWSSETHLSFSEVTQKLMEAE